MTIGDRIRNRREQLNLTQSELAKKMGYSGKSTICRAESAGNDFNTKRVEKFANALNTTCSYLMGWSDENGNPLNDSPSYDADRDFDFLADWHSLSPERQEDVWNMIKMFKGEHK